MKIIRSTKTDKRGKPGHIYFQVDPKTMEIIQAFEGLKPIDTYFNSKGVSTAVHRIVQGNFAAGYHAKGFLWAKFSLINLTLKSEKEITRLVQAELEFSKFMYTISRIDFKSLDKPTRVKVYKLLKPFINTK